MLYMCTSFGSEPPWWYLVNVVVPLAIKTNPPASSIGLSCERTCWSYYIAVMASLIWPCPERQIFAPWYRLIQIDRGYELKKIMRKEKNRKGYHCGKAQTKPAQTHFDTSRQNPGKGEQEKEENRQISTRQGTRIIRHFPSRTALEDTEEIERRRRHKIQTRTTRDGIWKRCIVLYFLTFCPIQYHLFRTPLPSSCRKS